MINTCLVKVLAGVLADVLTGVFITDPMAVSGDTPADVLAHVLAVRWWDFPGLIFEQSYDKVHVYECR